MRESLGPPQVSTRIRGKGSPPPGAGLEEPLLHLLLPPPTENHTSKSQLCFCRRRKPFYIHLIRWICTIRTGTLIKLQYLCWLLHIYFMAYKQFPSRSEPASCPSLIELPVRIMSLLLSLPRRSIPAWTPETPFFAHLKVMRHRRSWLEGNWVSVLVRLVCVRVVFVFFSRTTAAWRATAETPRRYHVDTSQKLQCARAIRGAQNYPIQSRCASIRREKSGK